jgi:hypothetical protein
MWTTGSSTRSVRKDRSAGPRTHDPDLPGPPNRLLRRGPGRKSARRGARRLPARPVTQPEGEGRMSPFIAMRPPAATMSLHNRWTTMDPSGARFPRGTTGFPPRSCFRAERQSRRLGAGDEASPEGSFRIGIAFSDLRAESMALTYPADAQHGPRGPRDSRRPAGDAPVRARPRLRSPMPTTLPIAARTRMGTPPLATDLRPYGQPRDERGQRRTPAFGGSAFPYSAPVNSVPGKAGKAKGKKPAKPAPSRRSQARQARRGLEAGRFEVGVALRDAFLPDWKARQLVYLAAEGFP